MKRPGGRVLVASLMSAVSGFLAVTLFLPAVTAVVHRTAHQSSMRMVTVPKGWKTYTYGKAAISVPGDWAVTYNSACPNTTAAGILLLGSSTVGCVVYHYSPTSVAVTKIQASAENALTNPTMVNGTVVYVQFGSPSRIVWVIPALDVVVAASAPDANRILHTIRRAPGAGSTTSTTRPARSRLPAVVNGLPLLELAKHALGASEGYSVVKPTQVRVVVATEAALLQLAGHSGGTTSPQYIITLHGRFTSISGDASPAVPPGASTTTTAPHTAPLTTMVLLVPMANGEGTTGIAVGVGDPDLATLGRVYDLDPYVASLAGVSVPVGPLPG
jgi:hypothetical protein